MVLYNVYSCYALLLVGIFIYTDGQKQPSVLKLPQLPGIGGQKQPQVLGIDGKKQPQLPGIGGKKQPQVPGIDGKKQPQLPGIGGRTQPQLLGIGGQKPKQLPVIGGQKQPQLLGIDLKKRPLTGIDGNKQPPVPGIKVVPVPTRERRCPLQNIYARCDLTPNPNKPNDINGTVYFVQKVLPYKCMYGHMNVHITIYNVPTNDDTNNHGLHVHEFGDMSGGCESMGSHFNPYNATHGSMWKPPHLRHVGDLGNVRQKPSGKVHMRKVDYLGDLYGRDSIVGRGLVLHAGRDDLGRNENSPESKKTGNAGARLACGVIYFVKTVDTTGFALYK